MSCSPAAPEPLPNVKIVPSLERSRRLRLRASGRRLQAEAALEGEDFPEHTRLRETARLEDEVADQDEFLASDRKP